MKTIHAILQDRRASVEEALQAFDALEPVSLAFMQGRWKGYEIETGHRMEHMLVPSGWYGKLFINPEEVHPLLFYTGNKSKLYSVSPKLVPLDMNFPKTRLLSVLMALAKPVLQTRKAKARMKMIEYRGKVTGTMVYDDKAICDFFVKVDDRTMLGAMDLKGDTVPYFFVLERDDHTPYQLLF